MKTTVYHCSPDFITQFKCDRGTHFGGERSAIQAGRRKLSNIGYKDEYKGQETLYMHVCELDLTSLALYETFDRGGDEEWQREIRFAREEGFKVMVYHNKYEPDTVPSYIVLDESLITIKRRYEVCRCDPLYYG